MHKLTRDDTTHGEYYYLASEVDAQPAQEPYDQTALELCNVCGWKTLIPDDGCLNCERGSLKAAIAQEPVGWQSIETAPKDGTGVLVYCQKSLTVTVTGGYWDDHPQCRCWIAGGYMQKVFPPTHWMPLPPSPDETLAQPAQDPHRYDWSMLEAAQESLREHMARIKELEAQLAQPTQEPVAWAIYDKRGGSKSLHWPENHSPDGDATKFDAVPLYTAPPQRPWVGLTPEEIDEGNRQSWVSKHAWQSAVWWASEKLKEKNNA